MLHNGKEASLNCLAIKCLGTIKQADFIKHFVNSFKNLILSQFKSLVTYLDEEGSSLDSDTDRCLRIPCRLGVALEWTTSIPAEEGLSVSLKSSSSSSLKLTFGFLWKEKKDKIHSNHTHYSLIFKIKSTSIE